MLQYSTIKEYRYLRHLINLWNGEFNSSFQIKRDLYQKLILDDVNLNKDASFIALFDNEPVGFIFIKTWLNETGLANDSSNAHISLMFVKKEMRNMGIGSDLLKLAIGEIKKHHTITKLVVGNEMNMIYPGVPNELSAASIFFVNKGFVQIEGLVDMIRVVRKDENSLNKKDLEITVCTEEEKDTLLNLCMKNMWNKEAYLINQYFENGGTGRRIILGLLNGKIIAFARINNESKLPFKLSSFIRKNKIGSIFFVKVDKEHQDNGYDVVMNNAAKNYLIRRGCNRIVVLATKDVKFYKQLGYSAYKYYLNFELVL